MITQVNYNFQEIVISPEIGEINTAQCDWLSTKILSSNLEQLKITGILKHPNTEKYYTFHCITNIDENPSTEKIARYTAAIYAGVHEIFPITNLPTTPPQQQLVRGSNDNEYKLIPIITNTPSTAPFSARVLSKNELTILFTIWMIASALILRNFISKE